MAPLRQVIDRQQDFRSSEDYPDGFIRETLDCGHEHIEAIRPDDPAVEEDNSGKPRWFPHSHNAARRRCKQCVKEKRK